MGALDFSKDGIPTEGGALADFSGQSEEKYTSPIRRLVADPLLSLAKGFMDAQEGAVGLADLATGGRAGKFANEIGYRPQDARSFIDQYMSPAQQESNRIVQEAKGFVPTVSAAVQKPSTIIHSAIESIPSMLLGWGLAQLGIKALPAALAARPLAATVAGAAGEGVVSAGSTAEQIRQQAKDGLLTPEQSLIAGGSGALTAGLGLAGGSLANRLGLGDIDTLLAGGAVQAAKKPGMVSRAIEKAGMPGRIAGGALSEGVFEELPQSFQEQVAQNLALGKPWMEGAPEAAAQGMLAGNLMGGAPNLFTRRPEQAAPPPPEPPRQDEPAPQAPSPVQKAKAKAKTNPRAAAEDLLKQAVQDVATGQDTLGANNDQPQQRPAASEAPAQPEAQEEVGLSAKYGLPAAGQSVSVEYDDGDAATGKLESVYEIDRGGSRVWGARIAGDDGNPIEITQGDAWIFPITQGEGTRSAPVKVSTSADLEAAAGVASTDYTPPQGEANNIQRGHVQFAENSPLKGLEATIEVPAGGVRQGTNPETGEPWQTTHTAPYGYWKGTKGGDGMHVDAYFGPEIEGNHPVYVLDELGDGGEWRQHKTMVGFPSEQAAREAYLGTSTKRAEDIGAITAMQPEEFKRWLKEGDTTKALKYGGRKAAAPVSPVPAAPAAESVAPPVEPTVYTPAVDKSPNLQGNPVDESPEMQGQQPAASEAPLTTEQPPLTTEPAPLTEPPSQQDAAPKEKKPKVETPMDKIRAAAKATGRKASEVKAQFLKDKAALGEAEALKRLEPAPKPQPKLLGKNAKGKSVYEDENGVRSYVDGGVQITESVDLIPTREGMKVSRGELKPEFKTTEELSAEKPAETVAEKPAEKPAEPTAEEQAEADLKAALADLGDLLLDKTGGKLNITPEQEQRLLPIMTRLFDAAFRLGHIKFKKAARFVRDKIRDALGKETADLLTLDHYQGGYIAMSARYRDKGSETAKEVAAVESLDEPEPQVFFDKPPPGGWSEADKVPKKEPEPKPGVARWERYEVFPDPSDDGRYSVGEPRGDGTHQFYGSFSLSRAGKPIKWVHFFESPSTRNPAIKAAEAWAQKRMDGESNSLAQQPAKPSELADLFDRLTAPGLPGVRAMQEAEARPDAEVIKAVNTHWTDILIYLEESKKVAISCK